MPDDELDESTWTVQDADGVVHRAKPQYPGGRIFVVTLCDWWKTHNVAGQSAPLRFDQYPTCLACVTHLFEAA